MFITDENRKWWILAATTSAAALVFLSQTIINVSLTIMQKEFNATETQVQWVVNSYLLVLASLAIAGGRISDIFGAKHCFIYGIAFFTLSSVACGFSQTLPQLILGRAVQGIGGALLIPANSAICMSAFLPDQRGRALGLQVGISGIFVSSGPFLGGILTEFANWRWVFWINFPFALFAVLFALIALTTPELPRKKESFGWKGLIVLSLGLSLFVVAIMQGTDWGWENPLTIGSILLGLFLIFLFFVIDSRMEEPLVDLQLLKNRYFIVVITMTVVAQSAQISIIFFAIYLQSILGFSPFWAGLLLMPATLPQLIIPLIAGRLNDSKGPFIPITLGILLLTIAMFLSAFSIQRVDYFYILPGIILIGVSVPLITVPSSITALNISPKEKLGFASGILGSARLIATSISLAIMGAVITFVGKKTFKGALFSEHLSLKAFSTFDPSEILSKNDEVQNLLKNFTGLEKNVIFDNALHAFNLGFTRSLEYLSLLCLIAIPFAFFNLKKFKKTPKL